MSVTPATTEQSASVQTGEPAGPEPEVVIIGAGPVGLCAAIALGRLRVRTLVLESKPGTSDHPRGHVENGRTMELFRLWGIEEKVRDLGLPREFKKRISFRTRMAGIDLGSIELREDCEWLMDQTADAEGPAALSSTPQDRLEPQLRAAAEALPDVQLLFGATCEELTEEGDHIVVRYRTTDGPLLETKAQYAIGADGPRSAVRESLGIATDGPGYLGTQLGVYFEADLSQWTGPGREAALYWLYNPEVQGVIISLDGARRWHLLFAYDDSRESRQDFTVERCERLVRELVGAEIPVTIRSVLPWRMRAAVATDFRQGRIFLAGDAAHAMPPTGGMGMNTGIADVHNLAWKLHAVLRGLAGERLLETYHQERHPVAVRNTDNSVSNARTMAETGLAGIMTADPEGFAQIEAPEGEELRQRLGDAIPGQEGHFSFDGLSFGYVYESAAVVADGAPVTHSTVSRYVPNAIPGARAPHVWLSLQNERVSTIDLSDGRWVVLSENSAWVEAGCGVGQDFGLDLDAWLIGEEADLVDAGGRWAAAFGVGEGGCVLVRPDGHVAFRSGGPVADPRHALTSALTAVLGRGPVAANESSERRAAVDLATS